MPSKLSCSRFREGRCPLGRVQPLHTVSDASPSPPSNTTLCLCFGCTPTSSRAPTIHGHILPGRPACRRPGQGAPAPTGRSLPPLVLRSFDWWLWGFLSLPHSDHTGHGWLPPLLLPEAHSVDSAPFSPTLSSYPHPMPLTLLLPIPLPTCTDQLCSALRGSPRASARPPAAS